MNRQMRKGVMTIEASVLIPMLTVLAVLLLTCLFYRHNLQYYTAAAAETALRGNAAAEGGERTPEGYMRESAAGRTADQPMPGTVPQVRVSSGEWGSSAAFSGQKFAVFRDRFIWETDMSVRRVQPAGLLREKWRTGRKSSGAE